MRARPRAVRRTRERCTRSIGWRRSSSRGWSRSIERACVVGVGVWVLSNAARYSCPEGQMVVCPGVGRYK